MQAQQAVLIVDDERNLCRILEARLRMADFAVVSVSEAASALQSLLRQPFALVLMDVRLPDANGIAVLPQLRTASPHTPFLLMTAYEEEGLRERALAAGASEILYKPFDLDLLVQTVRLHLTPSHPPPAPPPGPLLGVVHLGQAVVLETTSDPETSDHPARVTAKQEETFDAVPESPLPLSPGQTVGVRLAGEDGLYRFRTRVVSAAAEPDGALCLAKPSVIHRLQRRRQPRIPLRAPVTLRIPPLTDEPTQEETAQGIARDISLGGIGLILPCPIAPFAKVRLAWTLPLPSPASGKMEVAGVVVRCQRANDGSPLAVHSVAVQFSRLSPVSRARLCAYLQASRQI